MKDNSLWLKSISQHGYLTQLGKSREAYFKNLEIGVLTKLIVTASVGRLVELSRHFVNYGLIVELTMRRC